MVFSDLRFLYIFLPIFFMCYYLAPMKIKNLTLVLGSLIFYTVGSYKSPVHIYIFILSIIVDYLVGLLMEKDPQHKKFLLWTGIIYHFICLGYFKYIQFASFELAKHFTAINYMIKVALPIGISFYTFQGLSYIIDVYRGKIEAEHSLINYATFISMFEQLIAGPIVTYEKIKDDLKDRTVGFSNLIAGLEVFIIGLGLKALIANPLGKVWSQTTKIGFESISTSLAWMAIIAFSFQLYFDFFGYSMMAIGLGKMLGFTIPQNFNHPYLSRSMSEFWRRWHMTLGSWFREYVYIPLGGNRVKPSRHIFNMLVVWLCTGIWHGANWTFIVWGLGNFIFLIGEKYLPKLPTFISRIYTLLIVNFLWVIFKSSSIEVAIKYITGMFTSKEAIETTVSSSLPLVFICILMSLPLYNLVKKYEDQYWFILIKDIVLLVLLMVCVNAIRNSTYSPFIYGNF